MKNNRSQWRKERQFHGEVWMIVWLTLYYDNESADTATC